MTTSLQSVFTGVRSSVSTDNVNNCRGRSPEDSFGRSVNAICLPSGDEGQNPFAQARYAAIVQLAVFDAVNAITGRARIKAREANICCCHQTSEATRLRATSLYAFGPITVIPILNSARSEYNAIQ